LCRRDPKEEARHRRIRAVKAVPDGGLDGSMQGKALATMVGLGGLDATPTSPGDGRHGGGRGALDVAATGRRRRAPADEVTDRRQGRRRRSGTRDSDLVEKAHGHEGKAAATRGRRRRSCSHRDRARKSSTAMQIGRSGARALDGSGGPCASLSGPWRRGETGESEETPRGCLRVATGGCGRWLSQSGRAKWRV